MEKGSFVSTNVSLNAAQQGPPEISAKVTCKDAGQLAEQ
jgi:hypothetical protein